MATLNKGILGGFSGKVGTVVGANGVVWTSSAAVLKFQNATQRKSSLSSR